MSDAYCYKVRVGVVLIQPEGILLVRQNNRPFWVFPGGTLEANEGLVECAVREMKEEVNLDVQIEKILYLADFILPPAESTTNSAPALKEMIGTTAGIRHTVDVFILATCQGGTPVMETTENINEMRFFTQEAFDAMADTGAVQPALAATQVKFDWPEAFANSTGRYLGKYSTAL